MVCYIKHDNLYKENGKKFSAKLNYKNLPAPCRIYEKKWKITNGGIDFLSYFRVKIMDSCLESS